MRYACQMDTTKIQSHLDALKSFKGEYQATQEKRISNLARMAVIGCVLCFLVGILAGASYWYLYGYPPSTVSVEVLEVQEVVPVKVDSA